MTLCQNPRQRASIRRFFAGSGSPRAERQMREHLATCSDCRSYYERHLVLAEIDPTALSPQDRIARGLGLPAARKRPPPLVLTSSALAVAAVAVIAFFGLSKPRDAEFRARGAASGAVANTERSAELRVYRILPGGASEPIGDSLRADDELGFAYENPGAFSHLLVFAVDEHRHVYWYVPVWSDPKQTPTAMPIERGAVRRELPEVVRHDFDGAQLTLYGLFTKKPVSVRDVERLVGPALLSKDPFASIAGSVWQRSLRVEKP